MYPAGTVPSSPFLAKLNFEQKGIVKIEWRDFFDSHTSKDKVRLTASYCIWRIYYYYELAD